MSEWWKVSPEEMRRLLLGEPEEQPPAPASPPTAVTDTPNPKVRDAPGRTSADREAAPSASPDEPVGLAGIRNACYTPLHFRLGRALPRLWGFAQRQPEAADARELHRKLRELIAWALTKDGYVIESNVPTTYRCEREDVHGRLELLVRNQEGAPVLATETDWASDSASLLKLEVWHRSGTPALWIVGTPTKAAAVGRFRTLANRTLRQPTGGWLAIYHLEHGWVRTHSRSRP